MNELNQHLQHFTPTKISQPEGFTKGEELCNRTACQSGRNVAFYNKTMDAWYCARCSKLINNNGMVLCVRDDDRLYYEKKIKYQEKMTWQTYKEVESIFIF